MECKKCTGEEKATLLVNEIDVEAMRIMAKELMNDQKARRQANGDLIKWVLEKLGLWEEEHADGTGD